jgi:hypothetical protein
MIGMTAARKIKVSVSLAADLLQVVDRAAQHDGSTRSAVMERWLRESHRRSRLARLEEETAVYYDSLTARDEDEDARWAAQASGAARRLTIDEPSGPPAATGARRVGPKRKG